MFSMIYLDFYKPNQIQSSKYELENMQFNHRPLGIMNLIYRDHEHGLVLRKYLLLFISLPWYLIQQVIDKETKLLRILTTPLSHNKYRQDKNDLVPISQIVYEPIIEILWTFLFCDFVSNDPFMLQFCICYDSPAVACFYHLNIRWNLATIQWNIHKNRHENYTETTW